MISHSCISVKYDMYMGSNKNVIKEKEASKRNQTNLITLSCYQTEVFQRLHPKFVLETQTPYTQTHAHNSHTTLFHDLTTLS